MNKYLENGARISFTQLLEDNSVCIPMIQRDYVQGRAYEKEVRTDFLQALLRYLEEGRPFRDLDFVYGFLSDNNVLYPLDGQQRLTTLMLLHWYLANKENVFDRYQLLFLSKKENIYTTKFTYENRLSSKEFYNQLFIKSIDFKNLLTSDLDKNNSLSKTIKNLNWYAPAWDWDPTVQNTLNMLDAMCLIFMGKDSFFDKLTDRDNPIITFLFMDLGKNNLSDDLYIKMNSRGVQLSTFENFKAKLESYISKSKISGKYTLIINDTEKDVDFKTYYTNRLDSNWSNFVWEILKSNDPEIKHPNQFDRIWTNIFRISFLHSFLNTDLDNEVINPIVRVLLTQRKEFSLYDYEVLFMSATASKHTIISIENLKEFALLVDLLSDKLLSIEESKLRYYNPLKSFYSLVTSDYGTAYYHERIMFFAYTEYLKHHLDDFDEEGLASWLRFISNLSNNTAPYNNVKEFINAVQFIKGNIRFSDNIDDYLSKQTFKEIIGFDSLQYKEEVLKRKIEKLDSTWKEIFKKSELHPYLEGQTYFLLMLVGIEMDNFDRADLEVLKSSQVKYLDYFKIFEELFTDRGLNQKFSSNGGYLLERALLSIDDYTISEGPNFSFLIDSDRDISWKRMLKLDKRENHKNIIKVLFDILLKYQSDLSLGLENIINVNCPEWWRFLIINNPNILDYYEKGKKRYFRFSSKHGFVLLKGEKISGSHAEIESYNFYLNQEKGSYNYNSVSGENNEELPCAYVDFNNNGLPYGLDVRFVNNQFNIAIKRRQPKDYSLDLIQFFSVEGFSAESNYYSKSIGNYNEFLSYLLSKIPSIFQSETH